MNAADVVGSEHTSSAFLKRLEHIEGFSQFLVRGRHFLSLSSATLQAYSAVPIRAYYAVSLQAYYAVRVQAYHAPYDQTTKNTTGYGHHDVLPAQALIWPTSIFLLT